MLIGELADGDPELICVSCEIGKPERSLASSVDPVISSSCRDTARVRKRAWHYLLAFRHLHHRLPDCASSVEHRTF
jgi:hypothetical protein